MLKTLYCLLGATMLVAMLSSCDPELASDVNQDRIHTTYEVFYNSNTDKTWVIAQFRFGGPVGTVLELDGTASVTFGGEDLPYNAIFAGHYKEYAGRLNSGTFVYINADGDQFENTLPAYETVAFPSDIETISQAQAYDLVWDGTPLAANQRTALFVGSWTWGDDALFIQANEGANNIVMGTDQLANVALGTSTLYMDRTTEMDVEQGTSVGGKIRGKYRATNVQVTVIE